jgi:hypothetical protein
MNHLQVGIVAKFATDIIEHIMKRYGERPFNPFVSVNYRSKSGAIGYNEIKISGKSAASAFERGAAFRKTIHQTVAQLDGRYPNGYEGVYWFALNSAASFFALKDGQRSKTRINARAVAQEMRALSVQFSFDDIIAEYWDSENHLTIPAVAYQDPPEAKHKKSGWAAGNTQHMQTYIRAMVRELALSFNFSYGFRNDGGPHLKMKFKKHRKAYHRAIGSNGDGTKNHELVFGYHGIGVRYTEGFNEYAIVYRNFPELNPNNQPKGARALYWITCHEFAHALQTEIENGVEVKYNARNGKYRRSVHNMTFIREYRRIIEGFTFEDSLTLIDGETLAAFGIDDA